jgi:prepilin-type N-terminal cleavage/methylation domain-containing protein
MVILPPPIGRQAVVAAYNRRSRCRHEFDGFPANSSCDKGRGVGPPGRRGEAPANKAFTLIELMVVVAIIVVLAGFTIACIDVFTRNTKKAKSSAIVNSISLALTLSAGEGVNLSPAEHPLAGSLPPRPEFMRVDGSAVATAGEALVAQDLTWVDPSDRDRVLLATDLFGLVPATCTLPLLYGMPRGRIGIIGPASDLITTYRRLPDLNMGYNASPTTIKIANPPAIASVNYPDLKFLTKPTLPAGVTLEERATQMVKIYLGPAQVDIAQQGGIFTADTTNSTPATDSTPIVNVGYVRLPTAGITTSTYWKPGFVFDGTDWRRYRLCGTAVYDTWGNEILYSVAKNDSVRLESAGADGVFRWDPGPNKVFETAPNALVPAGDDKDGSLDNISPATRE